MEIPEDGVLIHGLFMDAFRWDDEKRIVTESRVGEMNPPLPMLHMQPKQKFVVNPDHYISSLYRTAARAGVLSTTGLFLFYSNIRLFKVFDHIDQKSNKFYKISFLS